jgi:RNA polymerase sigma-70 factor (ECF subfamily)
MSTITATIQSGSGEALRDRFEEVFRQHGAFVYRTAYSVTGNRQDAEDVVQTLFVKLLERDLPSALMRNPRAYLCRAAINLALNTLRARKRQRLTSGVELLEESAPAPDAWDSSEEIQRRLLEAMSRLKPKAVEILILRYEHNLSDAEIAQMLRKSRVAVAVALNRARARLKKLLDASSGEER